MILAALDFGSNTLKVSVAEISGGHALSNVRILGEHSLTTRVGEGLDQRGTLLPEAMERTVRGLEELLRFARGLGAERVACVATAGLRGAANAPELLERLRRELGLEVEIIHGLREAELAFKGPALSYGPGALVVMDVGGRSTEVVSGSGQGISGKVSLELGSVRLTERFVRHDPPQAVELEAMRAYLAQAFRAAPEAPSGAKLIGVSGTVLSLAGVALDLDDMGETVRRGEGLAIPRARIEEAFADLASKTTAQRIRGSVIPAGRADVIVAGALVVLAALDRYSQPALIASNRGLRFGLLAEQAAALGDVTPRAE